MNERRRTAAIIASVFLAGLASFLGSVAFQAVASRNGSGTYSLPAGNPVVTGTTISSTWANNTLSDLATEVTDSLDRSGKGGMLAALRGIDGTVGAPAYSWTSETGTGLYRIGSSHLGLAFAGAQEWDLQPGKAQFKTNTNPTKTTAFQNTLTPKNFTKAWAVITTNSSATPAVTEGFSVASVAASGTNITITWAQAFTDTNYAVCVTYQYGAGGPFFGSITSKTTTTTVIEAYSATVASPSNVAIVAPNGITGFIYNVMAIGAQ